MIVQDRLLSSNGASTVSNTSPSSAEVSKRANRQSKLVAVGASDTGLAGDRSRDSGTALPIGIPG
ncbi:hypothetical protein GCM10009744_52710 [Kribbella alba]|uniref:Uncharacterized protein n=1 Tax=Kribbella alba TaxID=190197 RepID=A0ABN2FNH6_9ACTN